MRKREWATDGSNLHDEQIHLTFEKPRHIVFEYMNEGNTGIRNNGMTVTYVDGEDVSIKLGRTHGLGFIVKGVASLVVGSTLSIFDSQVMDNEIFTINRAGFDYLARALAYHLPTLRSSQVGGVSLKAPGTCDLKYTPEISGENVLEIAPNESIFAVEDRYGTLAYAIFLANKKQFRSLRDVFVRKNKMRIVIPKSFLEFDLSLNEKTNLPRRFSLYSDRKLIGDYEFTNTSSVGN